MSFSVRVFNRFLSTVCSAQVAFDSRSFATSASSSFIFANSVRSPVSATRSTIFASFFSAFRMSPSIATGSIWIASAMLRACCTIRARNFLSFKSALTWRSTSDSTQGALMRCPLRMR
ncbi:hypothetical protein [Thiobacillus sp.]|uniref:hypothetical protein n=1 Tax=Thiobacillus sp. TaxID=924 RepID=UPI0025DA39F6|nr:hypothetical protein [Thiobacillus sp.]